jgi:hypothetical protein
MRESFTVAPAVLGHELIMRAFRDCERSGISSDEMGAALVWAAATWCATGVSRAPASDHSPVLQAFDAFRDRLKICLAAGPLPGRNRRDTGMAAREGLH